MANKAANRAILRKHIKRYTLNVRLKLYGSDDCAVFATKAQGDDVE